MTVNLELFKAFDFSEGVPFASVTNNGITFNKSVIMKLDYPVYVRLLINEDDRQIVLQPCEEFEEKAVPFYKEKPNGVVSVRWNSKDLLNTITRICDWDLSKYSYRIMGTILTDPRLMLFDLTTASVIA